MEWAKYKIYRLPEVVKRYKSYCLVYFYHVYDCSHLTIHENNFGLTPIFEPKKIKHDPCFDSEGYRLSDYQRRKWQKLSGNKCHIYALVCNKTDEIFYIGSTIDCKKRLYQHQRRRRYARKDNPLNKITKFRMVILCDCPQEFQFDEEKRWIVAAKKKYSLSNKVHNV